MLRFKRSRKKHESFLNATKVGYKTEIVMKAFDINFSLELNSTQRSDFLSPSLNLFSDNKADSLSNSIRKSNSECFYVGKVNNDKKSTAKINLCQQGHIVSNL